jgi:ribose transport system substrate-binding protein
MIRSMRTLVGAGASSLLLASVLVPTAAAATDAGSPSASTTVDKGMLRAVAIVKKYSPNPKTIGVTTKLTKKPASNVTIAVVDSGSATAQQIFDYVTQAATLFGWTVKRFPGANTPDKIQSLFSAALDTNPTAIYTGSAEPTQVGSANIQRSIDQGTFVVCTSCTQAPPAKNWNTQGINGVTGPARQGQILAAGVVVSSKGTANALNLILPATVSTAISSQAFNKSLKQMCPACKVSDAPYTLADIGSKVPGGVVSAVQRDPSINWITSVGALTTGVQPALAAAGFGGGKVQLGTFSGNANNVAALRSGTQAIDAPTPLPINAYRGVDAVARWVNKQPQINDQIPLQLLTNVNIKSAAFDSFGSYVGVAGALDQFKRVWLLN